MGCDFSQWYGLEGFVREAVPAGAGYMESSVLGRPYLVLHFEGGMAQLDDAADYSQLLPENRRNLIGCANIQHRNEYAIFFYLFVWISDFPEEVISGSFKISYVILMMNNAHHIGFVVLNCYSCLVFHSVPPGIIRPNKLPTEANHSSKMYPSVAACAITFPNSSTTFT